MFSSRSSLGPAAGPVSFPTSPGAGHRSLTAKGSGTPKHDIYKWISITIDIDRGFPVDYSPAPMRLASWALILCILVFSATFAADPLSIEPRDGVLILRNGFILPGRITSVGDSYLVSFGDRGEARLPSSAVEFECRSLEEAYRIKRDTLEADDAQHHLQLADWCMRHRIMSGAADQLLITRVLEPAHPALETLERRFQSLASMSTASATSPATELPSPANVTQANYTPPAEPTSSRDIEPFLVQQFTVTIQPILLNRCATHACHGAGGSTAYRLLRPSLGQAATSRLTHRNLQSTLAFIDRDQPESSRFLAMAGQPHGTVSTALFEDKHATQLNLIIAWVRRLGMRFPERSTSKHRPETRPASQIVTRESSPNKATRIPATDPSVTPTAATDQTPADPFDPEDFNRRFHGKP